MLTENKLNHFRSLYKKGKCKKNHELKYVLHIHVCVRHKITSSKNKFTDNSSNINKTKWNIQQETNTQAQTKPTVHKNLRLVYSDSKLKSSMSIKLHLSGFQIYFQNKL